VAAAKAASPNAVPLAATTPKLQFAVVVQASTAQKATIACLAVGVVQRVRNVVEIANATILRRQTVAQGLALFGLVKRARNAVRMDTAPIHQRKSAARMGLVRMERLVARTSVAERMAIVHLTVTARHALLRLEASHQRIQLQELS
jgi:hypothetical protein